MFAITTHSSGRNLQIKDCFVWLQYLLNPCIAWQVGEVTVDTAAKVTVESEGPLQ